MSARLPSLFIGSSSEALDFAEAAREVLVRNCSSWPRLDGCLRVTVGTGPENRAFLDALAAILA
jgi:histidinol-phosphate/aromatic aminotransferase/cobyric acid decarboxylase-like protein